MAYRFLRRAAACALILAALSAAACSSILDSSSRFPEEAEVTVTGTSPVPLQMVLSSNFIGIWNNEAAKYDVTLNAADTVQISALPITRRHSLNDTGVFFVRLTNADSAQTASIELRVRIDGRPVYAQAANMRDASLEYVFFVE